MCRTALDSNPLDAWRSMNLSSPDLSITWWSSAIVVFDAYLLSKTADSTNTFSISNHVGSAWWASCYERAFPVVNETLHRTIGIVQNSCLPCTLTLVLPLIRCCLYSQSVFCGVVCWTSHPDNPFILWRNDEAVVLYHKHIHHDIIVTALL